MTIRSTSKGGGVMKENPVVHFEIYAQDAKKLAQFYSSLFDWSIEPTPGMDYHYVKTDRHGRQGNADTAGRHQWRTHRAPGRISKTSGWINYVNVDSLDPAVKRAQDLGAKVMKPRAPVPGMGWFAMLVDPQGNSFAHVGAGSKRQIGEYAPRRDIPTGQEVSDGVAHVAAHPHGGVGGRRLLCQLPHSYGAGLSQSGRAQAARPQEDEILAAVRELNLPPGRLRRAASGIARAHEGSRVRREDDQGAAACS